MKKLIILIFVCFAIPAALAGYQVGDTAADFSLPDSEGETVSLYDYQGLPVLILFWGAC